MKTINEPLFTQVGAVTASARNAAACNIDREKYRSLTDQADGTFEDVEERVAVPLYLIAAAALLG
jgi:hypothetical protein